MVTLIGFLIFIYSIILHEIAHGLMAERLGDPTARLQKRLTLNPLPHIDPLMSILFPLFMILSRFPIIFGSAKPVPIDAYNLKNPKRDMGLIGLAGPLTNLLLAVILSLVVRLVMAINPQSIFISAFGNGVQINIILAVFNIIPLPPLDGGRIAVALLPDKYAEALASVENFGILIIVFLLLFPNRIFSLQSIIFNTANFLFKLLFPLSPLV